MVVRNSYRGESPGKKQARILFWAMVMERLGAYDFKRGPHLVISSKEAGDVACLLAMGVDPHGIHAVDVDVHAIAAANKKFGGLGVKFYVVDFALAHEFTGVKEFRSAFIDMCAPIRPAHLSATINLQAKLKGYEFLLGREKGLASKFIQAVNDTDAQHVVEPRLKYLNSQGFQTGSAIYYSSSTETTIGMSMCLALSSSIKPIGKKVEVIEVKFGYKDLRRKVARSKGTHMPMLYNVPRGVAAAWRAWETRDK